MAGPGRPRDRDGREQEYAGAVTRHSEASSRHPRPVMSRIGTEWPDLLEACGDLLADGRTLEAVDALTEKLRDHGRASAQRAADELLQALLDRPRFAHGLGDALADLLRRHDPHAALTESGVPSSLGLAAELASRVGHRVLPDVDERRDLRWLVHRLFPEATDHVWVEAIASRTWVALLGACGIGVAAPGRATRPPTTAIRTLTLHASSLGLDPEVTHRILPIAGQSPFLLLSREVLTYVSHLEDPSVAASPSELERALTGIDRCRREIERFRATKSVYGTSLHLTTLSYRLLYVLNRLERLLQLTAPTDTAVRQSIASLLSEIVRAENQRNRLLPLIRQRADLLALQTVEHAARAGSKYVTSGRRDYARFFVSSLGGGLIVAVFALFKTLMEQWSNPLALQALLYGVNYTICFVLIYLTGATLATKQPAMTANTIAQALSRSRDRSFDDLVDLVVRVSRSQIVSLVGNVLMALPASYALVWLADRIFGGGLIPPTDAIDQLSGLHPMRSGTLAFAAVAGVCLFLAGVIAGWVDNRTRLRRIEARISAHAGLNAMVGSTRAERVARFVVSNAGMLAGNTFLGFALGSMSTLGQIFGLPLDIRHVAFASAQFGISLSALQLEIAVSIATAVALGVVLVGLINFAVSFGLSMAMALESREITGAEVRLFGLFLLRAVWERPLDWFIPPREDSPVPTRLAP